MPMDVSIIIVNYNTKELISNCIQSIYEKTIGINYEIVVVDNASEDGSQQMITQDFKIVKLIKLNENIGFGRANNYAMTVSKGKYLFFLNSDTKLKNNAVKIFYDFMEMNSSTIKIGAIGSLLLNEKGEICHSSGQFPQFKNDIIMAVKTKIYSLLGENLVRKFKARFNYFYKKMEKNYFLKNESFYHVDYITGADLFVLAETFINFGGFDKQYFMYFEETDLQYKMKQNDYERLIIKGPEIYHYESLSFGSASKKSNLKRIYSDISRFLYYKKNYNKLIYYLFRFIFFIIQLFPVFNISYTKKERMDYLKNLLKPL